MNMNMTHEGEVYGVLFVCLGNICRSPAAEGIFRTLAERKGLKNKFLIDSAGTSGYHQGELPDSRMRLHASKRGYDLASRSRKFVQADFERFDYIVVMDDSNYHNVDSLSLSPEERQKIYRMANFLKQSQIDHIPDPYYSGAEGFELVLDLLEDACDGLLKYILQSESSAVRGEETP